MDFSRKGTQKKQQQIKSTSRKVASKAGVSLFRIVLVGIVFLAIVGSFAGFGILKGLADSAPDIDQINVVPTGFTTNIYDKDGNLIQSLIGAESNRVYVKINEIPEVVRNAFISIEDERFYSHDGVDVKGIFRAFFTGLSNGNFDEGASTITQQLIKNQVFNGGAEDNFADRLVRKVQEQYLAIQLEDKLDKDLILEYYLNNINLGAGSYGVQTASRRYFNKEVGQLNLSEAAVIASIAQSPTYMNPISHKENNAKRRAEVLNSMLRLGHCTEEEYNKAMEDDVYSRIQSVNEEMDVESYYSYFVDELIEQALEDLQEEKGYTYTQASNALYSGGLSIYTTLDSDVQKILDDVYSNPDYFPKVGSTSYWELYYALSIETAKGETIHYHLKDLKEFAGSTSKYFTYFSNKEDALNLIKDFKEAKLKEDDVILAENTSLILQPQSSMVIIDQSTGQVVGLIGGRGKKTGNRTLNRATNTVRQPGSVFKVLSTYLPALDSAGMTLTSVIDDAPFQYPGTSKYVSNWNKNVYEGLTTLRRAIYRSMNVVTVKTLNQVTPQVGFDYLQKLGFTSLVDTWTDSNGIPYSDINLSTALGGITKGVSNLELTAAMAAVANSGIYTEPTFYTKILDHDGKVLLEKKPVTRQVMKESTSFLLTNAMEDVVKIGTGTALRFPKIQMPIAGKTGTTSDDNDLWFSGYTPYYTATIWSGFDNNRPQVDKSYHKRIWRDVMEQIHIQKELKNVPFSIPDSIVTAKICTKSGKLAVEGVCDHYIGGSTEKTEYFAKGTVPTEKCDIHVKATICKDSGKIATEFCPPSSTKEQVYLVKEETHATHDTPNILPTETCDVHTAGNSVIPDFPDFPDFPPTDSQAPTPTPYPDDEDENDEDTIESEFPDIFNYNY
jgi:penicillin-binding protein 1A